MNPRLDKLRTYPFARLNQLYSSVTVPDHLAPVQMHIGEPQHAAPAHVAAILGRATGLGKYPVSIGLPELRASCAQAMQRRYHLPAAMPDPETMVVPVNGTREGIFSFVQAMTGAKQRPIVMMPNPFYQIYEGAALLAGAEPYYLNCNAATDFVPDLGRVPADIWARTEILFLCSPSNPTGSIANAGFLRTALNLADQHDFIVASDECYADIYRQGHPPTGLLEVCHQDDRMTLERCAVFHSLSKRSNVPGLRSGFIAASANIVSALRLYRTYHGCAMTIDSQHASISLWDDDDVARQNRVLYDAKFDVFKEIAGQAWPMDIPAGAFYLWVKTPYDDQDFSRDLYARQNLTVLPGSFMGRETSGVNPGSGYVRISLVPSLAECQVAAHRIVEFMATARDC